MAQRINPNDLTEILNVSLATRNDCDTISTYINAVCPLLERKQQTFFRHLVSRLCLSADKLPRIAQELNEMHHTDELSHYVLLSEYWLDTWAHVRESVEDVNRQFSTVYDFLTSGVSGDEYGTLVSLGVCLDELNDTCQHFQV